MKKIMMGMIFYFCFLFQDSLAHPHVFFDTQVSIQIEKKKMERVEVTLLLDEMNTLLNQKVFRASKEGDVKDKNIVFLKYLYSHIRVFWNGKRIPKQDILFELAMLEEEQLRIDFFVSIDKPIQPKDKLSISFYDTDYYYTYDYNKSSFHLNGLEKGRWNTRFYTDKGISFYFKTVHPDIYEVIFE